MSYEVLPVDAQFGVFDPTGVLVEGPFKHRSWAYARRRVLMLGAGLIDPPPAPALRRKCLCCPVKFDSDGPHNRLCPHCRAHVGGLDRQMVG